jgi:hypothetical protein
MDINSMTAGQKLWSQVTNHGRDKVKLNSVLKLYNNHGVRTTYVHSYSPQGNLTASKSILIQKPSGFLAGHTRETCSNVDGWGTMLHRKVARWSRHEVIIFPVHLIFPAVPSASGLLSLYQKWVAEDTSGIKTQPVRKAQNLIAIHEPIV